ncbi:MAG: hypothetical protein ACE5J0_01010 [Candidatus Paceibacterales bacterium]
MEEKNKQKQNKKEEECPLCEISEDTLKRLRESKDKKTEDKSAKNNER